MVKLYPMGDVCTVYTAHYSIHNEFPKTESEKWGEIVSPGFIGESVSSKTVAGTPPFFCIQT